MMDNGERSALNEKGVHNGPHCYRTAHVHYVPHQHEDSVETSFVPIPQALQRESAISGIQITIVSAAAEYVSNPKTARNVPGRQG
jgi:hypothetical protein